ncbi:MAG: hypothetical protein PUB04_04315 [Clostridia bacterium]|nr:hypothetical protein [Clostridia bacterium]
MRKSLFKKVTVVGSVISVLSASSILAFASGTDYLPYSGYAGSCYYSGEAFIQKDLDNGTYDLVGATLSSNGTADLTVRGYGTPDDCINKFWYAGGDSQTTYVSGSVKSNVSIGKNVGTAYVSYDDGDDVQSFTLYRS